MARAVSMPRSVMLTLQRIPTIGPLLLESPRIAEIITDRKRTHTAAIQLEITAETPLFICRSCQFEIIDIVAAEISRNIGSVPARKFKRLSAR